MVSSKQQPSFIIDFYGVIDNSPWKDKSFFYNFTPSCKIHHKLENLSNRKVTVVSRKVWTNHKGWIMSFCISTPVVAKLEKGE